MKYTPSHSQTKKVKLIDMGKWQGTTPEWWHISITSSDIRYLEIERFLRKKHNRGHYFIVLWNFQQLGPCGDWYYP